MRACFDKGLDLSIPLGLIFNGKGREFLDLKFVLNYEIDLIKDLRTRANPLEVLHRQAKTPFLLIKYSDLYIPDQLFIDEMAIDDHIVVSKRIGEDYYLIDFAEKNPIKVTS